MSDSNEYADIIRALRVMHGTILAETGEQFRDSVKETMPSKAADAIETLLAKLNNKPMDDEALVEIVADAINDGSKNIARAAIAAIRPHIEAVERERCAKIASGLCESCGGEGWLWAHELGIGLRNDDTKYSCDGQGESIACKIAEAIRRSGK